jgi:hypothetical protein
MEKDLKNIQWGEFEIGIELPVKNSKAYHKTKLKEATFGGISYVSRTNLNNGVESIVSNSNYKVNKQDTIVFGAENATFFYQPNKYITGNKMYYLEKDNLNKYSGLFIQMMLNKSIAGCGFGYGKGLIGSRVEKRFLMLPITTKSNPDYAFMEQFMRQKEQEKIEKFQNYIIKRIEQVKDFKEVKPLNQKEWGEFFIEDIFNIRAGKRLTKANMKKGLMPFIGASDSNNGITNFVSNSNSSLDSNILGVNYNGSVVENFYHPYKAIFSDDVKRLSLKKINGNEFLYLFIKTIILKQKSKFQYAYKFNESRMVRQKLLFPTDKKGQPDYDYMENYIKKLEYKKLLNYLVNKQIMPSDQKISLDVRC